MVRFMGPLALSVVGLLLNNGGQVRAEDKYIGAIWELRVKVPGKDAYESKGFFRATKDGKVYLDGKVVGSHKTTSLQDVEMKIDGLDAARNGTTKVKRVKRDGSIWDGIHKTERGVEVPVRLFLKLD
jgi:hypothetical protein